MLTISVTLQRTSLNITPNKIRPNTACVSSFFLSLSPYYYFSMNYVRLRWNTRQLLCHVCRKDTGISGLIILQVMGPRR